MMTSITMLLFTLSSSPSPYRSQNTMIYTAGLVKQRVKTDSHIACRSHAAPLPFPCHAVPLRV